MGVTVKYGRLTSVDVTPQTRPWRMIRANEMYSPFGARSSLALFDREPVRITRVGTPPWAADGRCTRERHPPIIRHGAGFWQAKASGWFQVSGRGSQACC